jgi:hypothetical protein
MCCGKQYAKYWLPADSAPSSRVEPTRSADRSVDKTILPLLVLSDADPALCREQLVQMVKHDPVDEPVGDGV